MPHTETAHEPNTPGTTEPGIDGRETDHASPGAQTGGKNGDRRAIAIAGALLLACGSLVAYGVLSTDEPKPQAVPTAEVTYEVLGDAKVDISYLARGKSGDTSKATVISGVRPPWKKTVRVPLGEDPIVSITLGEKGGQASCTLAIRGRHVQQATAFGSFGRAHCTGVLPAPETDPSATPAG